MEFSLFDKHIVESEDFTSFDQLPDKVKVLIDVNNSNQSYIFNVITVQHLSLFQQS